MRLIRSDKKIYSAENRPILQSRKETKNEEKKKNIEISNLANNSVLNKNGFEVTENTDYRANSDSNDESFKDYKSEDNGNNNTNNNKMKSLNATTIHNNISNINLANKNNNTENNNSNNSNNTNNSNKTYNINATQPPLSLVCTKVLSNGSKELVLRSVLSIKNNTTRVFQLAVRNGTDTTEASLGNAMKY